jgi:hypothetical protein
MSATLILLDLAGDVSTDRSHRANDSHGRVTPAWFGPGKSWPRFVQSTLGQKKGWECHKVRSPQSTALQSPASCLLSR